MAKPVKKKIEKKLKKQVEKGSEAVEKSAEAIKDRTEALRKQVGKVSSKRSGPSKAKVAGMAAAGVAGLAGIAVAVRYLTRDAKGRATLRVVAEESDWLITSDGKDEPLQSFRTKEEAVAAAREYASEAAPSELVIHRLDGSVMRSHSYDPS